ncbi:ATP-binding cassette domain-containing protein [Arthrobacter sp.]|uniref:ATP-binding cassette domain-containing protein n=1 Tax=Arthrobacter sp. TaxID=1667 RepID=UPI0036701F96
MKPSPAARPGTADPGTPPSGHDARPAPAGIAARGWGWRHAGRDVPALSGLDLTIRPGERVLLAGPSGAGKSTLLHALAGVLHADGDAEAQGELLVDGVPAAAGVAGLMQQDPETQVVQARVGDDVAFGAENLAVPRERIWPRVGAALDAVGLRVPLDHPTSSLSGGQKQRLALAGILAMRPGLVLLDEPTANLDPSGVTEVRDAVVGALDRTGATAVIVEHRLDAWAPHVDRVVVLEPGGGVAYDGTPGELFAPGPVRERLIGAGVWVPGFVPVLPERAPAGGGAALLAARDLDVARSRHGAAALTGVALDLAAGEALCVTGANGSGKSTLALTLGGLLAERAGALRALPALRGRGETVDRPFLWRAADLVGRIGTVFQEPEHQFVAATVRDELALGPRVARDPGTRAPLFTPAEIDGRVDALLDRLRLRHLADANPFTLSGGEKRRLSVATVLAAGPSLLVLDEPTFGQDANTWAELALLLREQLDAGVAVVAVTHDRNFAAALGARTWAAASAQAAGAATAVPVADAPSSGATGPGATSTPVPASGEPVGPGRGMPPAAVLPEPRTGLLEASASGRGSVLGRANPLAKLVAVAAATLPLVATLDFVSAGVVVAATALMLPLSGISIRQFLARAWPLLVAGLFGAWGTALVGNDSGATLLDLGVFTITEGSLAAGLATGLRAFAVALPAVLVLASTDPTDLANALAQRARLPHRFVLGALAGMRLLGLLVEEWQTLGMARRARGVGARGSLAQRTRANLGQAFGLLVQAIRRASRLAVTMEAKGFGGRPRTWARPSVFGWRDLGVLAGGLAVGTAATAAALAAGTWNLVWA